MQMIKQFWETAARWKDALESRGLKVNIKKTKARKVQVKRREQKVRLATLTSAGSRPSETPSPQK